MSKETILILEDIKKDFTEKFDNDPLVKRICGVMINEYKNRTDEEIYFANKRPTHGRADRAGY